MPAPAPIDCVQEGAGVGPGEEQMARLVPVAVMITVLVGLSGCTSITYNCNAAASCTPLAKTPAPAKADPKG